MKKNMQGFTLIELMIVIAIIAILVAIALPAYQDYTIRAKVTEGLNLAAAAKTAVVETIASGDGTLAAAADNDTVGYTTPTTAKYVDSITVTAGEIAIVTKDTGADPAITLTLEPTLTTPDQPISWVCTSDATKKAWVPASCR